GGERIGGIRCISRPPGDMGGECPGRHDFGDPHRHQESGGDTAIEYEGGKPAEVYPGWEACAGIERAGPGGVGCSHAPGNQTDSDRTWLGRRAGATGWKARICSV